ncbi:MAG: antibiotic biosynthesis monooxygenase family protein [Novosphingobium sp.]
MHLEVAILAVKDGNTQGLIKAMNDGGTAGLLAAPGCRSVKVLPGVENPGNALFLVEWDSVDDHNAARDSDGFKAFIQHASPFFGEGGSMQHFDLG